MSETHGPEWELYVGEEQVRTVTSEQLVGWIEQQWLNPGDRVRNITSNQWYAADDLGELLQEVRSRTDSSSSNSPTAANAAAHVLDKLGQTYVTRLEKSRSVGLQPALESRRAPRSANHRQKKWPARLFQRVGRLTVEPIAWPYMFFASRLSVRRIRRSWISVGVILALLCGSILWQLSPNIAFFMRTEQRTLASYETLWQEYTELNSRGADPRNAAEWTSFVARANETNQAIVAQLENRANVKNRPAQQLLCAGRDYFPVMLNGSKDRSAAEAKFLEHLETARSLMQAGDPSIVFAEPPPSKEQMEDAVRNATAWEQRQAISVAQESYLERSTDQAETDWWTVGMVVSDVSIVGLLGAWWYRKRRRKH